MTDQQPDHHVANQNAAGPFEPLHKSGSHWKALEVVAIPLVIGLFGAYQIKALGAPPLVAVSIVVVMALGLLALGRVVAPGGLTIDAAGLSWSGYGRSWQIGWHEIAGFRIVRHRRSVTLTIDCFAAHPYLPRAGRHRPTAIPGMLTLEPGPLRDVLMRRMAAVRLADPAPPIAVTATVVRREPAIVLPVLSIGIAAVLALMGAALAWSWRQADDSPRRQRLGLAVGALGAFCAMAAAAPVMESHRQYEAIAWLTRFDQPRAEVQSDLQQASRLFAIGNLSMTFDRTKAALAIAPADPDALKLQGDILFALGDLEGALSDYNAELQIEPKAANEYLVRGMTRYFLHDAAGASEDLRRAIFLDPSNLYGRLWRDIVDGRGGLGERPLDRAIPATGEWPAAVVEMFGGWVTPQTVAAIADRHRTRTIDQICETHFYTGEWDAIHNLPEDGGAMFNLAANECPPDFIESWAAKAEMRH